MHLRGARFRGQAGSGVWEMVALFLGNLGAKFSEMLFPHFKIYFMQIGSKLLPLHNKLKRLIPIISNSMFPFHNVRPIKRKAVYTGLGCSKAGYRYPPDKSLFNG